MMKNIAMVFFLVMTIFGLPGAFAPGGETSEEGETEKKSFDVEKGQTVLMTLLDYINGLGALAGDPSYDSLVEEINGSKDENSLIEAGKKIISNDNTEENLVSKGKENDNTAETMKQTFKKYMDDFWELLDEAGLDAKLRRTINKIENNYTDATRWY
ncbi:uncharacterized protein LOC135841464 isoform X2 [Planococcus citri]|uniref:uncharacterized protein LOC135841464 isoform X2 n=1 Tax=Planococcus citri TaxID=170843 RepID=UPI0031F747D9